MLGSKSGTHPGATSAISSLIPYLTSTSATSSTYYYGLEGFGPVVDIVIDQGPDGELTLHKPSHSAKHPVVQSPGSEQDAPLKQRL